MEAVLNVVLPVFGIMLSGYLCGRAGLLGAATGGAINGFVYYVALPALFFISMARTPIEDVFNWPFIAAFTGGILGTAGLSLLVGALIFSYDLRAYTLQTMSAIFANVGYMGVPLLILAFGDDGKLPGVILAIIIGAVVMGIITGIMEIDSGEDSGALGGLKSALLGMIKSPLVMSAVGGLAISYFEIALPKPIATYCDITGAAAGPAALFAMGLFMVGKSVTEGLGEVSWITFLKLVIQPAITWFLAYEVLRLPEPWAASAVIASALPTGALTFILADRYQSYVERGTAIITVSTVLSVVTLSLLMSYLGVR